MLLLLFLLFFFVWGIIRAFPLIMTLWRMTRMQKEVFERYQKAEQHKNENNGANRSGTPQSSVDLINEVNRKVDGGEYVDYEPVANKDDKRC